MIRVTLSTKPSTDQGTFGALSIGALNLVWISLELPDRGNSPQYSCIPAGVFPCALEASSKWSPRPDGLIYHVRDVPGRSLIKIHAATWAGDVTQGWHADLLGCIAPGKQRGQLAAPDVGRPQDCILQSRLALTEFMSALAGQPFELEVIRS